MNFHEKPIYDLVLSGAQVLVRSPQSQWKLENIDVAITDQTISFLGQISKSQARTWVDMHGLTILPGMIDTQVHFREPGLEHKENLASGTLGALLGGLIGIFEMPNTQPSTLTAIDLADKMSRAQEKSWTHYAFYMGASQDNAHLLNQLEQLPGCCGIKIFMGSSTGSLLVADDQNLEKILKNGTRRIAVHCEDEYRLKERKEIVEKNPGKVELHPLWRDELTALNATKRIVHLAKKTSRPIHILHVSTGEEMDFLRKHKDICTVECLPQYLTFSAPECYDKLGTLAQMNPPIRDKKHQEALWQAIKDGTVDVLGSDHAPHTLDEKKRPYPQSPSGMTGVQTILPIMLNHVHKGRLTLPRLVELMSYNPAQIWKMSKQGEIKIGAWADLTVVDLNRVQRIERKWIVSRSGWSPYEGMDVTGWPTAVIIRGKIAMRDGEVLGHPQGKPFQFNIFNISK